MTNSTESTWAHAQASRMEHQILDHIKQALRVTLEWKTPAVGLARKLSSVQFTLKSFQRHLQRVIEVEEADGYMRVVADRRPNLDAPIRRLQQEHREFAARLAELAPRLEACSPYDGQTLDELCAALSELLDRVDRHDCEEIKLLQESMLSDIGGEG